MTYCCSSSAKTKQASKLSHFIRETAKLLPEYRVESGKFNAGGVAVWGEYFVKIYSGGLPVIEAILTGDPSESHNHVIRQWNGRHSGNNNRTPLDSEVFANLVRQLSAKPFKAF